MRVRVRVGVRAHVCVCGGNELENHQRSVDFSETHLLHNASLDHHARNS